MQLSDNILVTEDVPPDRMYLITLARREEETVEEWVRDCVCCIYNFTMPVPDK